jgi:hypothetical protein
MLESIQFSLSNLDVESHTEIMKVLAADFVTRRQLSENMSQDIHDIYDSVFGPALGMRHPAGYEGFDDLFGTLDITLAAINRHSVRNHQNWALAVQMLRGLVEGNTTPTDLVDAVNEGAQYSNLARPIMIPAAGPEHQNTPTVAPIRTINLKTMTVPAVPVGPGARPARVVADEVVVERGGGVELTEEEIAELQADVVTSGGEGSGSGKKKSGKKGKGGKGKKK